MTAIFRIGFYLFLVAIAQIPDNSFQQNPQINVIKHRNRFDDGARKCGGNAIVTSEHISGCSNTSPCPIPADGTSHDHIIDFYPTHNTKNLGIRTRLTFENGTSTESNFSVRHMEIEYGHPYTLFSQVASSSTLLGNRANLTFILNDIGTGRVVLCSERAVIFV